MKRYFNPVSKVILDQVKLKEAHQNTIFPTPFEPPAGWFELSVTPKPAVDELSTYYVEGEPVLQGTSYVEVWVPTAFAPEVYLQKLAARKATLTASIDASVDSIYAEVLGGRAIEYQRAEREALDFQAAGFTGEVPPFVASWATASGLSVQSAAEDILLQASKWNTAATEIRAARLLAKQQVNAAIDSTALEAVSMQWDATRSYIRASLGLSN